QDTSAAVPPAGAVERPYDINDINDQTPPVHPAPVPPADDDAAFEAFVCRAIEQDQGLLPGSLALWEPITAREPRLPPRGPGTGWTEKRGRPMDGKPNGDGKGRHDEPTRPIYTLCDVLAVQVDNLHELAAWLAAELPRLQETAPDRLLYATWRLEQARRLII